MTATPAASHMFAFCNLVRLTPWCKPLHPNNQQVLTQDANQFLQTPPPLAGVGGWAESGINPAEYSRTLMRVACAYIEGADTRTVASASISGSMSSSPCASLSSVDGWVPDPAFPTAVVDPRAALDTAHRLTKLPGSATACVVQLDAEKKSLIAANLVSCGACCRAAVDCLNRSAVHNHKCLKPSLSSDI